MKLRRKNRAGPATAAVELVIGASGGGVAAAAPAIVNGDRGPEITLLGHAQPQRVDAADNLAILSDWSDPIGRMSSSEALDDWEATTTQEVHHPWAVLSNGQKAFLAVLVAGIAVSAVFAPLSTALIINVALVIFFAAANLFKLALVQRSLKHPSAIRVSDDELAELAGSDLPVYTILLPLYHEGSMLKQVVAGIARLDYPIDRLDVKILLEADDSETRAAIAATRLPANFEVLTVPDVGPRGKPRACNVGLARARGDYLVIYDAEDRPEPDQLRKVVAAFRQRVSPQTVCLQAKLNYFNRRYNVLTRWFTAEYSVWFDQLLPGLQSMEVAVPLGGTSNHFVVRRLREIGGWNPYNVTEDADLGIRLFVHGWQTAVIDTTTYEEATSRYGNWIRQRSRWVKGYMQTYLYQMRHPVRLYRRMGGRAFAAFHLFFGAGTLCLLLNPLYLGLTVAWFTAHIFTIQQLFPSGILYAAIAGFFIGNLAFILASVAGCITRRNYDDVKWALLAPVYWLLMSVGAYKALIQLCYRPYFWEKTVHGYCRFVDTDAEVNITGMAAPLVQPASPGA